jgi:integrase
MKLDGKRVAALKLVDKDDVIFFDDAMAGFGFRLRRGAGGKTLRSWIIQFKRAGATRRITLGPVEVLGAEAARVAARKLLAKVHLGEDVAADRVDRRHKNALTMRSQVTEFLAIKESELAPRSFVEVKRYLTDPRYFGPLHKMPIDKIVLRDVAARVVAIARERGKPTATRSRGALVTFFTWCMRMGLTTSNPTIGSIAPMENGGRDRVLSPDELARIWKACRNDDHGWIVRLLILTSCRRAEIGNMTFGELDFDAGTFTIPIERLKTGRKTRQPHVLPLLPMMRDVIKDVPRMATRSALFGRHSRGFTAWAQGKTALDDRSGVTNWVLHDIRRSVATHLGERLAVLPHVVEEILGHRTFKQGVPGRYNKATYAAEVRTALLRWEDFVQALVAGGERKVLAYVPADAS